MNGAFSTMIQNLLRLEFFQLLFPFLLALAILYGVLSWALEKQIPKSARGLISIIFAFFVMLYASVNPTLYEFLSNISGVWFIVASAILFLVILFGLTGLNLSNITEWKWSQFAIALIILYIVAVLFFNAMPAFSPDILFDSDIWSIIFFIIILAIVLYYLGKEEKKEG